MLGSFNSTSEVAISSQLAATLLSTATSTTRSLDDSKGLRDSADRQAGQPRPFSFDGVRRASQLAKSFPQRVPARSVTVFEDVAAAQNSLTSSPETPFILRGAMADWPAASWTKEELSKKFGDVGVPVEVSVGGGDYRDLHMPRSPSNIPRSFSADTTMRLADLLDHVYSHRADRRSATVCLAQNDLFALVPELESGIKQPPFDMQRLHKRSTWLGPAGTTTPLHRDPYFNFFCQVWGTKQLQLFPAEYHQHLYPFTNMALRNTSQVDVADVDATMFPLFNQVPWFDVTLQEGEMLYIPRKWFHFVQARTPSLSVSYWMA